MYEAEGTAPDARTTHACLRLAAFGALLAGLTAVSSPALAASEQEAGRGHRVGHPDASGGAIYTLETYKNATCNDGTPGAYYFRPSTSGSTRWLFYLEGGSVCYSDTTCMTQDTNNPGSVTSTGFSLPHPQGILSTDPSINPLFADANVVEVHYCSNDYWSGGKVAKTAFLPGNADSGWFFEGRAIAKSALQDLVNRDADTGFSSATDILFAGSSAGAFGMVYRFPDLLPLATASATKLVAIDGGYTLQINSFAKNKPPNYLATFNPFPNIVSPGMAFWNGHGNSTCFRAAMSDTDKITCYDTSAMLVGNTYVAKRGFIAQSQLDVSQLSQHNFSGTVSQDTAHMTYGTEFADAMRSSLGMSTPPNSIFSPQRMTTTMFTTNASFTFPEVFGSVTMTPSAALAAWYTKPSPPSVAYGDGAGLP